MKTLTHYEITDPKISIPEINNIQEATLQEDYITSWKKISKTTPDTLLIEMEISGNQIQIELRRKRDLLASEFSSENVLRIDNNDENSLEHRLVDKFHLRCHYSGHVMGEEDSHVTLSVCDGLVSLAFIFFILSIISKS